MRWSYTSVPGSRPVLPLLAAGSLGIGAAALFAHATAWGGAAQRTGCPVQIEGRLVDLGARWQHESVTASFALHNTSDRPVTLQSLVSECASYSPSVRLRQRTLPFGSGQRLRLVPGERCSIDASLVVRQPGEKRFRIECLAISATHSWPVRLSFRVRGEGPPLTPPRPTHLSSDTPLATFALRMPGGVAFAAAFADDDAAGALGFARPLDATCRAWTIGLMPASRAGRGAFTLPLDVRTADGRRLELPVRVAVD